MSLLLKNGFILNSSSSYHQNQCNILIEDGFIKSLTATKADEVVDLEGSVVTWGWFDLNANFNDPGREFKEDLETGSLQALQGGFTDVQVIPDTIPPIESKSDVRYIKTKSDHLGLNLHVSAALSEGLLGENLTEILDLHAAGASSFSDGDRPIWNSELLLKALQYTGQLNLPVFQNPVDLHLSKNTQMNEGLVSTNLGLRGEPGLSEVLTVKRDLDILRYAGGRLHFSKISTAEAVALIQEAKEEGLHVTADVAIHHLLFTEASIGEFDSIFKSSPPFRTEGDRLALIEGVRTGVIDAICSNHRPQDQESKQLEFDLAEPGATSLLSFYSSLLKLGEVVPFEVLIERVTEGPRKVLGLETTTIQEGAPAQLTLLNPNIKWVLDHQTNSSKSTNSPCWNQELTGKVSGVINGRHHFFFSK